MASKVTALFAITAILCCTIPAEAQQRRVIDKRSSLLDPFGFFKPGTTTTPPPATTPAQTSSSWLPSFLTPAPPTAPAHVHTPDRCKDPLKHVLSGAVEAIADKVLSYLPMVPAQFRKVQVEIAGSITDAVIDTGLQEGNMAGVAAGAVGMQLRFIPLIGSRLASYAEPLVQKSAATFLKTLCSVGNCCFD